jgi:signal transduction histidine kinase
MFDAPLAVHLLYVVLPAVALLVAVVLGAWVALNHGEDAVSRVFLGMLAAGALLSLGHLVIAVSPDPTVQWLAIFPRVLAFAWLVTGFVLFSSVYTGRQFHRRPLFATAILGSLGTFSALVLTNPFHGLVFSAYGQRTAPFGYVVAEPTALFGVLLVAEVALVAYATFAMVAHLLGTERHTGWQIVTFLVGISAVGAFEVAGKLDVFPATGLSHGGYGVLPFLLFVFLGIYRFDLFEFTPVARTAVVEQLRDPVLVLDADRRVVDCNRASAAIWPSVSDHLGRSVELVCPALASRITLDAAGSCPERLTLPVDGRDRYYSVTVSSVSHRGGDRTDVYSVLLRDVTALEQSRRQLARQNDRLDQVASTISHDLRNPITVADNYVSLVDERVDADRLDAESRDALDDGLSSIRGATGRMQDIVDDVLTIAREGKAVEQTTRVDLSTAAREAWNTVETGDARLAVPENRSFRADRSKLLAMLENFFRNAVEHGSTSPRSQAPQDAVEHGSTSPASQTQQDADPDDPDPATTVTVGTTVSGFFVQDDGPGVDSEHRERVFEYGYTTDDEGTGLGLSIVRTMAESHGWTVAHDQEYDGGARFVVGGVGGDPVTAAEAGERSDG